MATEAADATIEVEDPREDTDWEDHDSAFDAASIGSSTTSLTSVVFSKKHENGRTYHGYKDGTYILPNDEEEIDRQDFQHHLCVKTFDGKLSFAPFERLHHVLDVGTGTGIWAMKFADAHPEAEILGVDLSPDQPEFVPPNLSFEIDDLEEEWNFSKKFDYVHSMMMTGSFRDWPRFYQQSFEHLKPGGYLELQDIFFPVLCDDDTMPPTSSLRQWSDLMLEASLKLGHPLDTCGRAKLEMEAVGFVNVEQIEFQWPMNCWPSEPERKDLGRYVLENFTSGLEAMSLALFTRALGWTIDEITVMTAKVRADMRNSRIHAYWPILVVYGQKPHASSKNDAESLN